MAELLLHAPAENRVKGANAKESGYILVCPFCSGKDFSQHFHFTRFIFWTSNNVELTCKNCGSKGILKRKVNKDGWAKASKLIMKRRD